MTSPLCAAEDERLRLFIAGVTDYAIYMLSPQGVVQSWNAGAERFKGYSASEIIGQNFSRFYSAEDQAIGLPAKALSIAETEGKFEAEGWRVRKDGSQFWASVVIDPIFDNAGVLIGFAKITRDITERKKAEEALHVSEEQFRLLVQGVKDYAIYMLSPEGVITNWNSGAQRIKGFQDFEVVGSHFSRFYTDDDKNNGLPMKALIKALEKGRFESEGWRLRKDGTQFWAHVVIEPIKNDAGKLTGFTKVTRDITERRDVEAALEKTKEALFHSQKMEAIGKLTGGVAHDFNNLLSVIVNGLAILRIVVQNDQGSKVLDSMERAANRGAALTQQLLTFARQQPFQQEEHDLNRVINSFEAVLRRANKSTVKFELNLTAQAAPVLIDAPQFEAALLNLIVNAQDAIQDNGTISLTTSVVDLAEHQVNHLPAGRYAKTTVSDNGEGMSPEIIARVVEPFFTTKPVGKGTGLGLSQVYGLVQQSKGDLLIESVVGKGTSISLYIPLLGNKTEQQNTPASSIDKALVVDDQPDVLDMAAELFRTLGYDVLAANNAEEALNILKRNPDVGVLFSDVVMPGMSGVDLAHKARAVNPELNIILASGYTGLALETSESVSDFQFISKPYRIAEVVKKLRISN